MVTREITRTALELYEVDEMGLDRLDRAVLDALIRRFGGGPVGLSTLAVAVAEEAETVEVVAEPFLVRHGLLARTPARPGRDPGRLGAPGPDPACRDRFANAVRLTVAPTVTITCGNPIGWFSVMHSAATLRRLASDRHSVAGQPASGKSTGRMPRWWGIS